VNYGEAAALLLVAMVAHPDGAVAMSSPWPSWRMKVAESQCGSQGVVEVAFEVMGDHSDGMGQILEVYSVQEELALLA